MAKHIVKTVLRLLLLLFCVSLVCFILVEVSPIDPVDAYIDSADVVSTEQREEISHYFGLDTPPIERFFTWLSNIVRLDFGTSIIYREPVIDVIADRFVGSLFLMLSAWVFSGIIGVGLGIVMGANSDRNLDKVIKSICLTLSSIPTFLVGIVFLLIFAVFLGWFPIGFSAPIGVLESEITFIDRLKHLILPSLALSFSSFASIALHTREKLIEVLKSDFVLLAKTRGYSKFKIIRKHGLRNILSPIVTIQFSSLSEIFGGSVLAETVFSYPGLGSTIVLAGLRGDTALLLGVALFSAVFVFVGNLTANILYGFINPKIRLKKQKNT